MIDFHSHILPGIDDGSRNIEESMAILDRQRGKGTKTMIATPHFYPDDDSRVFVRKRALARDELMSVLCEEGKQDLAIRMGAEVLLSVDTWQIENLEELCIEGTSYILLEMPFSHWSQWVYDSVEKIIEHHKLRPIIAHVERYEAVMEQPNRLVPLLEMGALMQMNAYSLDKNSSRQKLANKLIKHQMIHLLGSDVHRRGELMTVKDGYTIISKQHGKKAIDRIDAIGKAVLHNEKIEIKGYTPFKQFFGWR